MSLESLIPILQISVGPVILISGVGLLLLSMTNRFGRVIDRSRSLSHLLKTAEGLERDRAVAQVRILSRRADIVRKAILWAAISVLLAACLIIALFVCVIAGLEAAWLVSALFTACLACLIGSLLYFISDINLSLIALRMELGKEPLEDPVNG